MHVSLIALQIAGAVMLLLYSSRMVRTGFERAAGPELRVLLLGSTSNVARSLGTGILVATLLQSSTAVALLVSGFASTGALSLVGALSVLLGADVGTALVVQFLSIDLAWLVPALLTAGGFCFLKIDARGARQIGRILMGIAFILISLQMIAQATEPLRHGARLPALVEYLGEDALLAFAGGLMLAFLFHSSVATVLLFATLCAQGILTLQAGLPLVLGANAGGALVALWLSRGGKREARRITLANVLFRTGAGLIVLQLLRLTDLAAQLPGTGIERQLVNFHLFFNILMVIFCMPFMSPMLKLTDRLVRDDSKTLKQLNPVQSALDRNAFNKPDKALASVTRELLRLSQLVEIMVSPVLDLFENWRPEEVARIRAMDKLVNEATTQIKMYIAELNSGSLSVEDSRRGIELTSVAINLERAGDIIAKDLLGRIEEKHNKKRKFSQAGWHEISALHARLVTNMQLALNVLISEDLESAKELVFEKARMGQLERETRNRHMLRLMRGTADSIATSDLHLEVVRALKEINSLYTSVAYPILAKYGVLLDNRIDDRAPA